MRNLLSFSEVYKCSARHHERTVVGAQHKIGLHHFVEPFEDLPQKYSFNVSMDSFYPENNRAYLAAVWSFRAMHLYTLLATA